MKNKLTVLSFGVGQDSVAILFKIIHDKDFRKKYVGEKLIVVTADTKNEHDHTYKYLEYLKPILKKNNIEFYLLDPSVYASKSWKDGLVGFYNEKKAVGSKAFPKTCTDNLKIRPIYKFLENYVYKNYGLSRFGRKKSLYEFKNKYGKINVLLGIAHKEEKRAQKGKSGIKWMDECIEKTYPLIEEKMDRKKCQDFIKKHKYKVPFPSNCIFCPFMSLQELLYLYRYDKKRFDQWVIIEKNKLENNLHKGSKNLGVWGTNKTLLDVIKDAEKKFGHMTKTDLVEYKMSHGHCVKSKF